MFKGNSGMLNIIILLLYVKITTQEKLYEVDIPIEHVPYFLKNSPLAAEECQKDDLCPFKKFLNFTGCWGYEKDCQAGQKFWNFSCKGSSDGWVKTKAEQEELFFEQGDFGYIRDRRKELTLLCRPEHEEDSLLECIQYMRLCRAKNILINFKNLLILPEPMRYREDVLQDGMIGGHCALDTKTLKSEGSHKSPLQSWFAELQHFTNFSYRPLQENKCDIVFSKPTVIMKLDATVNMYHHFCDFLNLYATLHFNKSFSEDFQVIIWDTFPYRSSFAPAWKAFTKHKIISLREFKGKKVCFQDVLFPFLPRMIFGMYYNMPLVPGCIGSGLFKAFNQHFLHRLGQKYDFSNRKIKITLLSRSTKHRQILNEEELIKALEKIPNVQIKAVDFNYNMDFLDQLKISCNSDILIGIHGAGLTHLLFQPDWGVVFEIYNCEDENCYKDLARLRGLKYLTWKDKNKLYPEDEGHHPTLGAHAKFTNYRFDVDEFLRIVHKGIKHVKKLKKEVNEKHAKDFYSHNEL